MPVDVKTFDPQELTVVPTERQMFAVRFSPCGRWLVGSGFDALVHRWDAKVLDVAPPAPDPKQRKPKGPLVPPPPTLPTLGGHRGWVTDFGFAPDGERLFSADSWGRLNCWNLADAGTEPLWTVDAAHDGWLRQLAVSPDGQQVVTCGMDRYVRVWNAADGQPVRELDRQPVDVRAVQFHPDGQSFVTGDFKGHVLAWNTNTGSELREFDAGDLFFEHRLQEIGGLSRLTFSPDGQTLVVAGHQPKNGGTVQGIPTVLLFDWASGKKTKTWEVGVKSDVEVFDLHWHADGFLLVVTSGTPGNGKFLLLRPEDDQPFFETKAMANCHALSLHPDGLRVAVTATNRGSNGNGRRLDKDGEYANNTSPVHIWRLKANA